MSVLYNRFIKLSLLLIFQRRNMSPHLGSINPGSSVNLPDCQLQPASACIISNKCKMLKSLMSHGNPGFTVSAHLMNRNPNLKLSFLQYFLNKICIRLPAVLTISGIFLTLILFLYMLCSLPPIPYHIPEQIIIYILNQLPHLLRNLFFRNIHCFQIQFHIPQKFLVNQ